MTIPSSCILAESLAPGLELVRTEVNTDVVIRMLYHLRYMVAVFETKTYVSMLTEILAGGIG